ncbi:hypothetical protein [Microbacterium arabinogalactanolyticum]|nr:hypothetical protein [Microbacterium arabinogalactanolyticum]GLC86668.1 hypothetical protein MIAR_32530 [Microbacterium arabinogalactanolyticum]
MLENRRQAAIAREGHPLTRTGDLATTASEREAGLLTHRCAKHEH